MQEAKGLTPSGYAYLCGRVEGHLSESPTFGREDWDLAVRDARQGDDVRAGRAIRCPICKMVSYNPNDISEGYCGNCNDYTGAKA